MTNSTNANNNDSLANETEWLYLAFFCCLGAFVLHCKLRTENQVMVEFIKPLFPRWESPWQTFLEAFLFALIGGVVSYGLVQPITTAQALSAGLGWTGLISAFSKQENYRKIENLPSELLEQNNDRS